MMMAVGQPVIQTWTVEQNKHDVWSREILLLQMADAIVQPEVGLTKDVIMVFHAKHGDRCNFYCY